MTGFSYMPSGRKVFDTGRVLIGLRIGEEIAAPRQHSEAIDTRMSADAEAIQAALLRKSAPTTNNSAARAIRWALAFFTILREPTP